MQRLTNFVHGYRELALVMVHHSRKMTSGDPIDDPSGSTGLTGGVDNLITISRTKRANERILALQGRRIKEDDKIPLRWDTQLAQWSVMQKAASLSPERQAVLELLRERPGLPAGKIATILGKDDGGLRRLLAAMLHDGHLTTMQGLYYADDDE